ncbi:hypothetical protein [Methanosphaera sp. BMS]|uniref:hypothetical protein n=1 Tax=Methanosphaera sp. BMS TaxID=1789762 RepID=UPI001F24D6D3|nr:hypothetical protein [Methanosphaera sp. BMS]
MCNKCHTKSNRSLPTTKNSRQSNKKYRKNTRTYKCRYHLLNPTSLSYFKNKNIDGLIPTRKQSKEIIGKLNKNPFHKDHFEYIREKDVFKCPSGQYLTFYNQYTIPDKDPEKPAKIKRLYNNYTACKNCKYQKKLHITKTNTQNHHRKRQ